MKPPVSMPMPMTTGPEGRPAGDTFLMPPSVERCGSFKPTATQLPLHTCAAKSDGGRVPQCRFRTPSVGRFVVVGRVRDSLGFDGMDAGTLPDSWRQQPGTPAYCRDLDADGLKAALRQADAGQIARYRAEADEAARPYFT